MDFQDNNTNNGCEGTLTKDTEILQKALNLCKQHFDNEAYDAALEVILPLQVSHPNFPEVVQAIATIFQKQDKNQQAVDILEAFLKENPNSETVLKMIADIYFNHNMFKQAKEYFLSLHLLYPDEATYLSRLGDCDFHEQDFPSAINYYNSSLERQPNQARALNNLGTAYIANQQTDNGIASYKKACDIDPELVEAQNNLGLHFMDINPEEAKSYFKMALVVKPSFLAAKFNLCLLLLREKQYQTVLETLADLNPDNIEVKGQSHLISDLYLHCHDYCKALEYLEIALDIQPNNVEFRKNAIIMAEHIQLNDKIHYHMTEGLKYAPDNLELLLLKANLERTQGNYQKAQELLEEILNKDPGLINAYISLSLTLLESGNPHASIVCSDIALTHAPDYPDIHHMLAIAYVAALEPLKAMTHAQKAIELSPTPQHNLTMGEILQEQGDSQNAYHYYHVACSRLKEEFANKAEDDVIYYDSAEVDAFARCLSYYFDSCQWQDIEDNKPLLNYLMHDDVKERYPISPRLSQYLYKDDPKMLIAIAEKLANHIKRPAHRCYQHPTRIHSESITIGYLASDLQEGLISFVLQSILPLHSEQFKPRIYSIKSHPTDAIYQSFINQTDIPFIDISQKTNKQAADLIYQDKVDILIDLSGYSEFSRPEILAYTPAPIQLHYLNFQGTMGASYVPYHILSEHQVSDELRSFYTEKLVALQSAPVAMYPLDKIQPTRDKATIGLPSDKTILATQCPASKISKKTLELWQSCLKQNELLSLWIRTSSISAINAIRSFLHPEIEQRVFCEVYEHENDFSDIQHVDIYLDTFEHSQTFLPILAITQETPVITLREAYPQSQFTTTILKTLELSDWVIDKADHYHKTIQLLSNPDELASAKNKISDAIDNSSLFQPSNFMADLEQILELVLQDYDKSETDSTC